MLEHLPNASTKGSTNGRGRRPPGWVWQVLKHRAWLIKHQAPITKHHIKHRASSINHQASSIKHQATSTKHQAPSTKHQAPSTKHHAQSKTTSIRSGSSHRPVCLLKLWFKTSHSMGKLIKLCIDSSYLIPSTFNYRYVGILNNPTCAANAVNFRKWSSLGFNILMEWWAMNHLITCLGLFWIRLSKRNVNRAPCTKRRLFIINVYRAPCNKGRQINYCKRSSFSITNQQNTKGKPMFSKVF